MTSLAMVVGLAWEEPDTPAVPESHALVLFQADSAHQGYLQSMAMVLFLADLVSLVDSAEELGLASV